MGWRVGTWVRAGLVLDGLEWVEWVDTRRPPEPIGTIPPAEAEEECYAAPQADAVAV